MARPAPLARAYLLLCVLFPAACGRAPSPPVSSPSPRDISLEIVSGHWEDLTVYLERGGSRFRLGTVPGNTSRVLRIPDDFLGPGGWVRLVAVETGRQEHVRSDAFAIQRGERAIWRTGPRDHVTPVVVTPTG